MEGCHKTTDGCLISGGRLAGKDATQLTRRAKLQNGGGLKKVKQPQKGCQQGSLDEARRAQP